MNPKGFSQKEVVLKLPIKGLHFVYIIYLLYCKQTKFDQGCRTGKDPTSDPYINIDLDSDAGYISAENRY